MTHALQVPFSYTQLYSLVQISPCLYIDLPESLQIIMLSIQTFFGFAILSKLARYILDKINICTMSKINSSNCDGIDFMSLFRTSNPRSTYSEQSLRQKLLSHNYSDQEVNQNFLLSGYVIQEMLEAVNLQLSRQNPSPKMFEALR